MSDAPDSEGLSRSLRTRHVEMIAIGGIIGAGLFVGSGAAIATIGPAALVSYALAGLLVMLVMRMLGEIAVNNPQQGSFVDYIRLALGQPAGFISGWLYWYVWVIVIAIEAIIGAQLVSIWVPLPPAAIGCALLAILTAVNLFSARSFGELEFWLSSIKVGAILVFIVVVGSHVFGLAGDGAIGLANLTGNGGFAPRGTLAVLTGVTTVIFSMVGAEIVTVSAVESREPARIIASMTSRLVIRVLLFYIVSVGLILCVVPWTQVQPGVSPFATALTVLGIPSAATIMNVVVLIAVLSALNSGIYVTSRILFRLSQHGEAPKALVATGSRKVPVAAVLLSTAFGYAALIVSVVSPSAVFVFLVNASGALSLLLYGLVGLSQIRLRRAAESEGRPLALPMWLFPGLSYLTVLAIAGVLVSMLFSPELASQLYASAVSVIVAVIACVLHGRRARRDRATSGAAGAGVGR